ncbi:MAG TPA: class I SAM-dependent methyltransferase [bacterium]
MSGPRCRRRTDCRLCGSRRVEPVLSLAATPPANAFVDASARGREQERFPLDVRLCRECSHAQLLDVVDPELLFRNYVYVSGTSPVFVEHFRRYAAACIRDLGLAPGDEVLEIGSNDGTFLGFFKEAGLKVLGVDPARAIAEQAAARGIETRPEFFDQALASRLAAEGRRPKLIAANNVFAHADDLHGIAEGVADLLAPDGAFVFEVSYLVDVYEKTLFDTIYHEHLSYHSVKPLIGFFARHGLCLTDALRVDPHGGSLRGVARPAAAHPAASPRVEELVALERRMGLHGSEAFVELMSRIERRGAELTALLSELKASGARFAGFGAPAKATTLMYQFGLGAETLEYIVDESPLKQGLFSPGLHIPVVPASVLQDPARRPDVLVILAWNFAEPIMKQHRGFLEAGGKMIVPLPEVRLWGAAGDLTPARERTR